MLPQDNLNAANNNDSPNVALYRRHDLDCPPFLFKRIEKGYQYGDS